MTTSLNWKGSSNETILSAIRSTTQSLHLLLKAPDRNVNSYCLVVIDMLRGRRSGAASWPNALHDNNHNDMKHFLACRDLRKSMETSRARLLRFARSLHVVNATRRKWQKPLWSTYTTRPSSSHRLHYLKLSPWHPEHSWISLYPQSSC
jgi:hypothetical protein